jgi:hypothetical protein
VQERGRNTSDMTSNISRDNRVTLPTQD